MPDSIRPEPVRLDVWLDVACVCKTRSAARQACLGGKISVNGARAKPNREIRAGDRIGITGPHGRGRELVVRAVEAQHVPKATARELYEDVTPPPTPEELELRDLLRRAGPVPGQGSTPDRRNRRQRSRW